MNGSGIPTCNTTILFIFFSNQVSSFWQINSLGSVNTQPNQVRNALKKKMITDVSSAASMFRWYWFEHLKYEKLVVVIDIKKTI